MAEEKKNMPTVDGQYQRLIDARNFHYNNLNKWLITFYAIIGALFLALWTLHASATMHRHMELCVAVVGYVVSIAAYLSGKGYYYWEINWIMLIHNFEKKYLLDRVKYAADKESYLRTAEDDYRVYSVFANKNANNDINSPTAGANISTSKVALSVTWFISMLWGTIVAYFGIKLLNCDCLQSPCCGGIVSCLTSFFLTQVLIFIGGKLYPSNMLNLDDLKL